MKTLAERVAKRAREDVRSRARRARPEPDSVRLERNRRSRQARAEYVPATHQLALSPIESEDAVTSHSCGPMDQTRSHCNVDQLKAVFSLLSKRQSDFGLLGQRLYWIEFCQVKGSDESQGFAP